MSRSCEEDPAFDYLMMLFLEASQSLSVLPTPVAAILAVARDGDVMPQGSTSFYPKALTGLVINPHEW